MSNNINHYQVLKKYISDEVVTSLRSVRVISYAFVSVLLIGGAGVWMPWMKDGSLPWLPGSNVFTYVFALLGALLCNRLYFNVNQFQDIRKIIRDNDGETIPNKKIEKIIDEFDRESILSSWGMIFGSVILLLVSYSYAYYYNEDSIAGFVALLLSVVFYLVSTARDIDNKTNPNCIDKDGQDSSPIIPLDNETDENFDANFFQTGK